WNWMKGNLFGGGASVPASLCVRESERLAGTLAPPDEIAKAHLTPALSPHPMGGEGEDKFVAAEVTRLTLTRNSERGIWENIRASLPRLLPVKALVIIIVSIGVLAFWNLRHTEHSTTRRAFSVANVNDFSWRKRVAAYEGALQMI